MKAAVMEAVRKPLVVRDMPDPQCPPNGVIIRPRPKASAAPTGIGWSGDWTWIGLAPPMPLVMGHEFCGVVEEVGKEVKNFKKGDRVLVPFSQGDGICEYCRNGNSNVCENPLLPGFSYWGGYGRYVGVPFADLNLVPYARRCRFSRRRFDGLPLHDLLPRDRRPRAGAAGRMGRGPRMRRNRPFGDSRRVGDWRQRYRG